MKINIKCFAQLAKQYSCNYREAEALHLETGATVKEAMDTLGVPESDVKIKFVNSRIADSRQALREGDRLSLVPATGGM